jgi:hypothetical protein
MEAGLAAADTTDAADFVAVELMRSHDGKK